MKIEEKKTILTAVCGAALFLLVQSLHITLNGDDEREALSALYLISSWCTSAFGFAIFAQGWLLFSNQLSRGRLYSSALFLGVCVFDLLHTLGFIGIPFIQNVISEDRAFWLLSFSRLASAVGILLVFGKEDSPVLVSGKNKILRKSILLVVLSMILFSAGSYFLPEVISPVQADFARKLLNFVVLLIYLLDIVIIVYTKRAEKSSSLLIIIRSLVLLALGQAFYMDAGSDKNIDLLFGAASCAAAYYLLLTGVYRLTLEEPFYEKQAIEAQINYLVYHDDLTGLPNRRRLLQHVDEVIESHKTSAIRGFSALAVLNINHFKDINVSLGHLAGDRLLQLVASRIKDGIRPNEDLFSMGGDEFTYLMTDMESLDSCFLRSKELLNLFEQPIELEAGEYHISLSLGISIFPGDGDTAEQLIQNADTAVHDAKEHGVDIRRYVPLIQMKAKERLKLENDLRRALEREEFFLLYQPQVRLATKELVGMEALLRWQHPKRGLVSPAEFIPIAEESGLIVPIGEWVLRTACSQNKEWQKAGYRPICVSVNLSMRQFLQPNLAGKIGGFLKRIGLDPSYVDLEITESMTMDKEKAFEQLKRLKELGVYISIDDFGTGYSSLHYLKNMPIDRLKIDRSFVAEVMEDSNNAAIVSTITSMAHHLKLRVTAEGVENEDQLQFLRQQRCHEAQGYFFSKPIRAQEFERIFLKSTIFGMPS
ncbi:diguanylate cyclase (GGDEF) domain-containing protein [Paenibacillus sophorae]|uniref:Diguanylate cyclase (GGDEF) domain-containing protein n=1 Tax=Paenibacillus sophorae TaxID=1333845 RepID=A0A1H8KXL7_9BACL|nr:EAL domain-containing protein [Paenibacillus sophorae]QWU17518.1 EAL domain-containing protein [Paenibacillus sophorae]SEN97644.1 diguanylate cyclase (GGDEF) domain-containing protein [Paenibacillus sophorae]